MIVQDYIIAVCVVLFACALIPQIVHNFKNKRCDVTYRTSGITFMCLYIVAVCYFTLDLAFSFIASSATATLWLVIFVQRYVWK